MTFPRHCADVADPLAESYEVIIGTGMRKGEALAPHWADVHLEDRVLFVRYTLGANQGQRCALTCGNMISAGQRGSVQSR